VTTYGNHVILGAGGAISRALVPELLRNKQNVLLVSRSGTAMDGTRGVRADVTDAKAVAEAVPEESVVYLLVGLRYDVRVWRELWPRIMENMIKVCREKNALLVFFDNVYAYGPVKGPMTEQTPHKPTSKKGEIRARIADQLIDAYCSGSMRGIIARSGDFYGPGAEKTGIPNLLVVERLLAGKSAQWLADLDTLHSLTYTIDCGRALPLLVADETAYNQVWHLPTAHPPITMRRFIELAAGEIGVDPKLSVLSGWMVRLGGLFDRAIKELPEMLYQNRYDYVFDSTKFEKHFSFDPTPYEQGTADTMSYHRRLAAGSSS